MSFLYPRIASVRRLNVATSVGDRGLSGQAAGNETTILAGPLACSIQESSQRPGTASDLPGEPRAPTYKVYFPKRLGLGKDAIRRGDIIVDDLGQRYQVSTPVWTSLGFEAQCLLLEP